MVSVGALQIGSSKVSDDGGLILRYIGGLSTINVKVTAVVRNLTDGGRLILCFGWEH